MSRSDRLSLKFLLSNSLAGTLIGSGGGAIKELIEVTEARITVSSITDVYPGTSERILLISGLPAAVQLAQSLVWDMIASSVRSQGDKSVSWSPRAANENGREDGEVAVTGKITIPASAGGLVLGRGGAALRAIAEESGARVQMSGKDEAMFTQERVLTIAGSADACDKCVSLIVDKLAEDLVSAQYVNRGVTYNSHLGGIVGTGLIFPQGGVDQRYRGRGGKTPAGGAVAAAGVSTAAIDITANTEITINVPDSLVGNILGRQVSASFLFCVCQLISFAVV